eukprot:TRINITY_DN41656_c0_g1_i1.p1 TRINITY_DN41656_c0_g1~~TRINITY_DN41656_c0_g1_i1.p1  ORF type:complete len:357 (-),score=54.25 TRINITY_DN41656_c0_g1_i1:36-1043(-)
MAKTTLAKKGRDAPGHGVRVSIVKHKAAPAVNRPRRNGLSHGIAISDAQSSSASARSRRLKPKSSSQRSIATAAGSESAFPGFPRPTARAVERLHAALAAQFGERQPPAGKPKRKILDTVVGTILSQNTTNVNSARAFRQLMRRFKGWDAVRVAKPAEVADAIKCGGLAPKKTKWIQHILKTLQSERGKTSMEYLRKLSKEGVHAELERFPGIGKKTAAIINSFDVGHPDMAVDTHVFRYALQLGWAPTTTERQNHNSQKDATRWPVVTRDTVYAHLDATFPDWLKYSMHLILTDTIGGLPVVCGSQRTLGFDGDRGVFVDGQPLSKVVSASGMQ